jgi:periplasmic protein TonB
MRDAVADVLEERQALAGREWSGYPASIVLHLGLALALFGLAHVPETPKQPVLTVRLAAPPQPAATANARVTAPAPQRSRVEPPPPPPEVKPEPRRAPPALKNQETLFGQAAAKPRPTTTEPQPTPAAPPRQEPSAGASFAQPTPGIGMPGVGQAGITGIEGGDFPYTFYLERMVTLVGGNWLRPETGADVRVVVYFRIDRGGEVRDARISNSSGSGPFDRAALRAVLESSPLPPLPSGYRDRYLGVHLTFH